MQPGEMMIGWTTTATREDADRLARGLAEAGLAACAQVSGPIMSFYRWSGRLEQAEEFRISVKYAARHDRAIQDWLAAHHPYETPQWVAVPAAAAAEKYLKWVLEDRS